MEDRRRAHQFVDDGQVAPGGLLEQPEDEGAVRFDGHAGSFRLGSTGRPAATPAWQWWVFIGALAPGTSARADSRAGASGPRVRRLRLLLHTGVLRRATRAEDARGDPAGGIV